MANFAKRPQPYRLKWPLTAQQVESIDEMFEILFKRLAQTQAGLTNTSSVAAAAASMMSSLMAESGQASDEQAMVGGFGGPGLQGLIGNSLMSLFEDVLETYDVSGPFTPANEFRVSAYGTALQSIVTATFVAATLDAEDYKVGSADAHDNVTNNSRIVVKETGYHLILGGAQFANNAIGQRVAIPRVDGTTFLPGGMRFSVNSAAATSNALVALVWFLNAGQYIELMMFQDTGGNLDTGDAGRFAANSLQLTRLNFR